MASSEATTAASTTAAANNDTTTAAAATATTPVASSSTPNATAASTPSSTIPVPPLHTMFTYSHFKHPMTLVRKLIFLAYIPLGIALVCARIVVFLILGVLTFLAPNSFFFPVSVSRALAAFYGYRIRYRVHEQPPAGVDGVVPPVVIHANDPAALQRVKDAHRPLLMTCNHISTFDIFPFMMLTHVMVLVDAGFFKVIGSTFRKMVGSIPLDQTDKSDAGRLKTHNELKQLVKDVAYPLLFFPEGWDTNGKKGVLMFNKFMFGLGQPVLPTALRIELPFLPLHPSILGTTFFGELLWMFFYPTLTYDLTFLPVQVKEPAESDADFALRCQRITANALGVAATPYFNKDALAHRRRLITEPSLRERLHRGEPLPPVPSEPVYPHDNFKPGDRHKID